MAVGGARAMGRHVPTCTLAPWGELLVVPALPPELAPPGVKLPPAPPEELAPPLVLPGWPVVEAPPLLEAEPEEELPPVVPAFPPVVAPPPLLLP